jgi:tRNA(Ile)-lysidine synthetase-like protein
MYQEVLEFPKNNIFNYKLIDINDKIYKDILNFVNKYDTLTFIVSLSGGVDSFTILATLHFIKETHLPNINIIAIHLNYKNRDESDLEAQFLMEWCNLNNITYNERVITEFSRGDIKRADYEAKTQEIRFDFYKENITKYEKAKGIILGHHQGDIQENIFSNIMKNKNILDLGVITEENIIHDVLISRPLISCVKKEIFDYAHKYNIAYFKDTTPDWSVRGKLRRRIFPEIENAYGLNFMSSLSNLSESIGEWETLIRHHILNPCLINSLYYKNENEVQMTTSEFNKYPKIFWSLIIKELCHKNGIKMISNKAMDLFLIKIKDDNNGRVNLSKNLYIKFENRLITFYFNKY